MRDKMTYEQALAIVKQPDRIGCNLIKANDEESNKYNQESIEALNMVRKALEIVIDFERAQIITGGRLNGRTYAYKCGLEDGKRKALEQQPTSDDCVSRQAVLDCLTATGLKKFDFILDAREKVNNLPPATPARKVGKWIKTGGSFRCSECMVMPEFKDIRTLKYCPNCAAEMRGYENE